MKLIVAILIPLILFSCSKGQTMEPLGDFQWKNRIIIIGVSGNGDFYVDSLNERNPGIMDRDIVWFVLDSGGIRSNLDHVDEKLVQKVKSFISGTYENPDVILIGKDGGVKNRSDQLDIDALFRRIDAMPMRIREMRQK